MAERLLKPPAAEPGARIAVVAPASSAKAERIERGMAALRGLGYDAVLSDHARGRHAPYFSGSVEERLGDLHGAFADPEVAAIICTRGGYGSNYLLEGLDLDLIGSHPKPLFGYSDLTVMQTWLLDRVGLVSFHGPMAAADFYRENGVHEASFRAALEGERVTVGAEEGMRTLRAGRARGRLYGGCLSMLAAALGTRFAAETEGTLLFLEDRGVQPYQLDRLLRQMILGGKFEGVRGFIFGEMLECASPGAAAELLEEVIVRVLAPFDVPIAIGVRSGHVSRECVTLPLGVEAELILDEEQQQLQITEAAVRKGRDA